MKRRAHVFYCGQVQGIGFRYTTREIASRIGVAGWVRNLRDGRVEVVAEGEEEQLITFLEQIENGPLRAYIEDVELTWSEETESFNYFETRPTASTLPAR